MPSFISGLVHAGAQGTANYAEGDLEAQRMKLALAQQERVNQRENVRSMADAANAGLDISPISPAPPGTPAASGGTGAPAASPTGPTAQAGPSGNLTAPDDNTPATAAGPTVSTRSTSSSPGAASAPIAQLGGMNISVPAGGAKTRSERIQQQKIADRQTRLKTFATSLPAGHPLKLDDNMLGAVAQDDGLFNTYVKQAGGMANAPQVPKEARIQQLVSQGVPLAKASLQARLEYGDTDPVGTLAAEVAAGLRKTPGTASPVDRAKAIRNLAVGYMKPTRGIGGLPIPGMSQADAFKKASSVYEQSQANVSGEPLPDDPGTAQPAAPLPAPPKPKLSPADAARAASDPGFAAWLKSKGKA